MRSLCLQNLHTILHILYSVASKTLTKLDWNNSELIIGDVPEGIKRIKEQDRPELQVHGSSNLVQTLLKYDLVDELRLKIFPVTLSTGKV